MTSHGAREPLDHGGYFDLTPHDLASPLRRKTALTLEKMDIGVESSHHEGAPSQHEIDLRYTDALTMADSLMTFRLVVKEIAAENGVFATFMPKPSASYNGSGMHINMSLFKGGKNAFFDPKKPDEMSKTAQYFLAGLLKHSAELTLFTNQWVNSYKRLVPGFEAPTRATWAMRSRDDLVRVPGVQAGPRKQSPRRISLARRRVQSIFGFCVTVGGGFGRHQQQITPLDEESDAAATDFAGESGRSDSRRARFRIGARACWAICCSRNFWPTSAPNGKIIARRCINTNWIAI